MSKTTKAETEALQKAIHRQAAISSADMALSTQGIARANGSEPNNDRVWDWLRDLKEKVHKSLGSGGIILMFTNLEGFDEALKESGLEKEFSETVLATATLTKEHFAELNRIFAKHSQRRGSSCDSDDLMTCIVLSQSYIALADEHNRKGGDLIAKAMELAEKVGVNTQKVTIAREGQARLVPEFVKKSAHEATH